MDFTIGFVSRNIVTQKHFVEFRDSRIFMISLGGWLFSDPGDEIFKRILEVRK